MYPETYIALEYKRGSQNRNHFTKMKEEEGYVSKTEKSRLRKRQKKVRMIDPGAKPSGPIVWKCPKCTRYVSNIFARYFISVFSFSVSELELIPIKLIQTNTESSYTVLQTV